MTTDLTNNVLRAARPPQRDEGRPADERARETERDDGERPARTNAQRPQDAPHQPRGPRGRQERDDDVLCVDRRGERRVEGAAQIVDPRRRAFQAREERVARLDRFSVRRREVALEARRQIGPRDGVGPVRVAPELLVAIDGGGLQRVVELAFGGASRPEVGHRVERRRDHDVRFRGVVPRADHKSAPQRRLGIRRVERIGRRERHARRHVVHGRLVEAQHVEQPRLQHTRRDVERERVAQPPDRRILLLL
mmetsp:Transcript_10482/g.42378  ORF Transcript_10482/g.42378 Transcript_10482/m.42378 type:complete len:251 (-) Transcript_10482:2915-3667(-)